MTTILIIVWGILLCALLLRYAAASSNQGEILKKIAESGIKLDIEIETPLFKREKSKLDTITVTGVIVTSVIMVLITFINKNPDDMEKLTMGAGIASLLSALPMILRAYRPKLLFAKTASHTGHMLLSIFTFLSGLFYIVDSSDYIYSLNYVAGLSLALCFAYRDRVTAPLILPLIMLYPVIFSTNGLWSNSETSFIIAAIFVISLTISRAAHCKILNGKYTDSLALTQWIGVIFFWGSISGWSDLTGKLSICAGGISFVLYVLNFFGRKRAANSDEYIYLSDSETIGSLKPVKWIRKSLVTVSAVLALLCGAEILLQRNAWLIPRDFIVYGILLTLSLIFAYRKKSTIFAAAALLMFFPILDALFNYSFVMTEHSWLHLDLSIAIALTVFIAVSRFAHKRVIDGKHIDAPAIAVLPGLACLFMSNDVFWSRTAWAFAGLYAINFIGRLKINFHRRKSSDNNSDGFKNENSSAQSAEQQSGSFINEISSTQP